MGAAASLRSAFPLALWVWTGQGSIAVHWNEFGYRIADAADHFESFTGVRALAMMHLAMHDALNAIVPRFEPYALKETDRRADSTTAAIVAASLILSAAYPADSDAIETERDRWLQTIPDGVAKQRGKVLGARAAAAVLRKRRRDRYDVVGTFAPGTAPGEYRYTVGVTAVYRPGFRFARGFAMTAPGQFRPPPPPALTSETYARDLDEVMRLGRAGSRERTPEQTRLAHWWAEVPEHSWNRIARTVIDGREVDLWEATRTLALVNLAIYDVYLAAWDAKYQYHTWRPETAIHLAADSTWAPELATPPAPEYPSTHSAVCAAEATVLAAAFGTVTLEFRTESATALEDDRVRGYDDVDAAARDCAESRIMNGYHFRFSTVVGREMGQRVAHHLVTTLLRERP